MFKLFFENIGMQSVLFNYDGLHIFHISVSKVQNILSLYIKTGTNRLYAITVYKLQYALSNYLLLIFNVTVQYAQLHSYTIKNV